jgi:hypothetical protein
MNRTRFRDRMPGAFNGHNREQAREDLHAYLKREQDHDELQEITFPNLTDSSHQGINPRRLDYTIEVDPASIIGFGNIGGMRT